MRRTVRQLARRWPTEEVPWEEDEYRQLQQAAVQHPLPLEVPPRARRGLLAVLEGFLRRMSAPETLSTDVAEALVLYRWPFNVRELEQVVTASTLRAQGSALRREHLPEALTALLLNRSPRGAVAVVRAAPALEVPSREELCRSLESNDGSVAKVAEHFGKDRRQIYRWAERLGVDPDSFRRE